MGNKNKSNNLKTISLSDVLSELKAFHHETAVQIQNPALKMNLQPCFSIKTSLKKLIFQVKQSNSDESLLLFLSKVSFSSLPSLFYLLKKTIPHNTSIYYPLLISSNETSHESVPTEKETFFLIENFFKAFVQLSRTNSLLKFEQKERKERKEIEFISNFLETIRKSYTHQSIPNFNEITISKIDISNNLESDKDLNDLDDEFNFSNFMRKETERLVKERGHPLNFQNLISNSNTLGQGQGYSQGYSQNKKMTSKKNNQLILNKNQSNIGKRSTKKLNSNANINTHIDYDQFKKNKTIKEVKQSKVNITNKLKANQSSSKIKRIKSEEKSKLANGQIFNNKDIYKYK